MTSYVSADLRRRVRAGAGNQCEYCLIHERDTYLGCQIDHVIGEKHGGQTELDNLALACTFCNRAKGSDVGSQDLQVGQFVRFYNPRTDSWGEHFGVQGSRIEPKSPIGEVTVRILRMNDSDRLLEREALLAIGRFPRRNS